MVCSGVLLVVFVVFDVGVVGWLVVYVVQVGVYSECLFVIDEVSFEYCSGVWIVCVMYQVSFDVYGSDCFVLFGLLGCGKLMLLKVIVGFIEFVLGLIVFDGWFVCGLGFDCVVVFQEFDQLLLWKMVVENVVFLLCVVVKLLCVEVCECVLYYFDKVGLSVFVDVYLYMLLGGMKQCVVIVWVLVMQLCVLLMDELFVVFDVFMCCKMQEELLWLWDEFCFMLLFVMYLIEEVFVVGNWILLLLLYLGCVWVEFNSYEYLFDNVDIGDFCDYVVWIYCLLFDIDVLYVLMMEDVVL